MKLKVKVIRAFSMLRQEFIPLIYISLRSLWNSCFGLKPISDAQFVNFLSSQWNLDAEKKAFFCELLHTKKYSQTQLLWSFFRLPAYFLPKFAKFPVNDAHHAARLLMVRDYLPKADRILDLGGASDSAAEGALLSMGYKHKPSRVCIVDQPIEMRKDYDVSTRPPDNLIFESTKIDYHYTLMSDLRQIPSGTFDLVWTKYRTCSYARGRRDFCAS